MVLVRSPAEPGQAEKPVLLEEHLTVSKSCCPLTLVCSSTTAQVHNSSGNNSPSGMIYTLFAPLWSIPAPPPCLSPHAYTQHRHHKNKLFSSCYTGRAQHNVWHMTGAQYTFVDGTNRFARLINMQKCVWRQLILPRP